jgi:hypothetical protein
VVHDAQITLERIAVGIETVGYDTQISIRIQKTSEYTVLNDFLFE